MMGAETLDILDRIGRLHTGITQRDNARMFELLGRIHPLTTIHAYPAGREHNGWIVPHHCQVERATIRKGREILFDGTCHPLAVVGSSGSFTGKLTKEELDKHVFFSKQFPDAFLYHPMNNLRPWQKRWGFCIPWSIYAGWGPGDYEIDLRTTFLQEDMLVGEVFHRGRSPETIVFNAHTCHPCQVNDGLSGAAVILELFRWLAGRETRYSYLGVLAPEHLGTVFYLADMPDERLAALELGVFLESIGSQTPLKLQESFHGDSIIDEIARYVLRDIEPELHVGPFRTVVGNDETVWEAPGIEVPMVSVTRHPFPHYHTSEDNVANQSRERLDEVLGACQRMISILEDDALPQRRFKGLLALSNPKHDLYRTRPNPTLSLGLTPADLRWGLLQDYIIRYFDGRHGLFHIAQSADLPFEEIRSYVANFAAKGLVELLPMPSIATYRDLRRPRRLPNPTF